MKAIPPRRLLAFVISAILFSTIPSFAESQGMFQDEEVAGDIFITTFLGNAEVNNPWEVITVTPPVVTTARLGTINSGGGPARSVYVKKVIPGKVERAWVDSIKGPYEKSAFGSGLGANYFFLRYFGLGIEGAAIGGGRCAAEIAMGTFCLRYPMEGKWHLAPYLTCGIGGQFADTNRTIGCVGAGIEKRFARRTGLFVDCRYVFDGEQQKVTQLRMGMRFGLGPGKGN